MEETRKSCWSSDDVHDLRADEIACLGAIRTLEDHGYTYVAHRPDNRRVVARCDGITVLAHVVCREVRHLDGLPVVELSGRDISRYNDDLHRFVRAWVGQGRPIEECARLDVIAVDVTPSNHWRTRHVIGIAEMEP